MTMMTRATLAQQAYEEIKAQIVSGRLPPGQRLLAEELAGQLSISQTPVKEALAELERDGLVAGASRRASVVRRFIAADIVEIYEARILIEVYAAGAAVRARRVTADVLAGLQATYDAQVAHAERRTLGDLAEAIRLDREFHEAIVTLGGNTLLAGWHRLILRQTQTIRSYSLERYDVARVRAEHAAIIAALRDGSSAAAARASRAHLTASRDEMLSRAPEDLPPLPGTSLQ